MARVLGTPSWPTPQPGGDQPRLGKEVARCESYSVQKCSLVTGCEFRSSGTRLGRGDPANGESRFARSRGWTVRSHNHGSFLRIRPDPRHYSNELLGFELRNCPNGLRIAILQPEAGLFREEVRY